MFGLQFAGPFKSSFFGLTHFTGLKFCFTLIKLYLIRSNKFCFKIFEIFPTNEMRITKFNFSFISIGEHPILYLIEQI